MRYSINNTHSHDNPNTNFSDSSFYSLFVGLNNRCPGAQAMSPRQAMTFVEDVCARYFINGYTILEGKGADRGTPAKIEPSVYIMAINAAKSDVFQVAVF
jgi:hypothetical protein